MNNECGCSALSMGSGGQVELDGPVGQLLSFGPDCVIYAAATNRTLIEVVDGSSYERISEIPLPGVPKEIFLSHNGTYLVASARDSHTIWRVDTESYETKTHVSDDEVLGVAAYDSGSNLCLAR